MADTYTSDQARSDIAAFLSGLHRRNPNMQFFIKGPLIDEGIEHPEGASDQPFHGASIGKLFTATLTMQMVAKGKLSMSDRISDHLPDELLIDLFVHGRVDRKEQVTVQQLLTHTSGVADHFLDPVIDGPKFIDLILSEPDRIWTPEMILDYSRGHQRAIGRPGEKFHYSDTGYILLGLMLERLSGKRFHELLKENIFDPLGMSQSYLMFHSEPSQARAIRPIKFNGLDVTGYRSLSCDWSGGGVVSTPRDLDIFIRALFDGQLVDKQLFSRQMTFPHRFRSGIHYGTGMMELRPEGLFFLLRGYPRLRGHIGILSTHVWYDPDGDTSYVVNFGSDRDMRRSFQVLLRVMGMVRKLKV